MRQGRRSVKLLCDQQSRVLSYDLLWQMLGVGIVDGGNLGSEKSLRVFPYGPLEKYYITPLNLF